MGESNSSCRRPPSRQRAVMDPEGVRLASAGLSFTLPVWAILSSSACKSLIHSQEYMLAIKQKRI